MKPYSLSKDIILRYTNAEDIYIKFLRLNEFPKGNVSSPFSEDKNPSLKIWKNGTFKCNSSGKQGDVFQFVADLNQLDSSTQFKEILQIIATEMNIPLHNNYATTGVKPKTTQKATNTAVATENTASKLSVEIREFTELDLTYWKKLGVEKTVLEKYKVHSISSYTWTGKKPFYTKKESVAFAFELDGNFKLYIPNQPEIGIKKNVLPPFPNNKIFGLAQLGTEKIENLIICEGEKDTIVANSRGFNTVTFGSGSLRSKQENIKQLQSRCNNLFVCFDADETGITGMQNLVKSNPEIIAITLPKNEKIKGYDVTDYFQEHTANDFQKITDLAVKNKSVANGQQSIIDKYSKYELPKEIKTPITDLIDDIEKYNMFMANNQIWVKIVNTNSFKSVSNFIVEIIQHMQDEKLPMKLIKIRNVHNKEKIFDVLSDKINNIGSFDNIVTSHGNYLWTGDKKDFDLLRKFLFDKMGNGKKIDCLGWQKEEAFWIWNNSVNLCDGSSIEIDENGIFKHKDTSFYVPSANKVYKENAFKFEPQKRVNIKKSTVNIDAYLSKMKEVHREHSISAMLFTISSIFQDIIVHETNGFPILFFEGQTSSGKDQLAKCCQSFFGIPQEAINIEGGVSTIKAHIREFAQFGNIICQFSEYKNGDKTVDGILKGIWDRNGYKRGTLDSHVSTESVPILSSLILTGNHSPDDDALITRLLWMNMSKSVFSESEENKYNELADMTEKGISSFTDSLLKQRSSFLNEFKPKYRLYKKSISARLPSGFPSRFSTNFAILGATYEIFKDIIIFPFTQNEMMEHFIKTIEFQLNKINSASASNKWWDCFLVCMKNNGDNNLVYEREFKVEGNRLYFNFSNVYDKIQRQWYNQYKETIPSKSTMQETVKKEKAFLEVKPSCRIRPGRDGSVTSAFVIDYSILNNYDEINEVIHFMNTPLTLKIH